MLYREKIRGKADGQSAADVGLLESASPFRTVEKYETEKDKREVERDGEGIHTQRGQRGTIIKFIIMEKRK